MLHTLLLACCLSQFTVSVEKPIESFTVEVERPSVSEYDGYYVVMFSASWCGPCRSYKDSGKLDKIKNTTRVVEVDTYINKTYYTGRIPRFWICKNKIRVHEFPEGTIEPEVILQKIKDLSNTKPVVHPTISNLSIYNGKPNNSHTNRQSLINHLMTESIHRGRHSLSQLEKMSDVDLDNLHNLDHTAQ